MKIRLVFVATLSHSRVSHGGKDAHLHIIIGDSGIEVSWQLPRSDTGTWPWPVSVQEHSNMIATLPVDAIRDVQIRLTSLQFVA